MKRITAIIAAFVLTLTSLAACGNSDTPTSEVNPSSVTTTVTTGAVVSTLPEVSTTAQATTTQATTTQTTTTEQTTTTSKVTTTVTTTAKPVTTTTTTKATETTTAKPVVTTTKKTTTAKVTTTKAQTTKPKDTSSKGKTVWVKQRAALFTLSGLTWEYYDDINKGEKVTVYEELDFYTGKFARVKTSTGIEGGIYSSNLSDKEIIVIPLTQADIDEIAAKAQEYADKRFIEHYGVTPKEDIEKTGTYVYEEYVVDKTPENTSWTAPTTIYPWDSYEAAYNCAISRVDCAYAAFSEDIFVTIYTRWYPDGKSQEGEFNFDDSLNGEDCWQVFALVG